MPTGDDSLAVVVLSCDHYSDLWKPFFQLFDRHWPNCSCSVYLASNTVSFNKDNVKTLLSGEDHDWSSSVKKCIEQLDENYVLLLIDDGFLSADVKEEELFHLFDIFIRHNMSYLRLKNTPKPDEKFIDGIGRIKEGRLYRTAIFPSMWKKKVLVDLLKDGESAWEFELKGAGRSDKHRGFYGIYKNFFPIVHGVIKGKWTNRAVKDLQNMGVSINLELRKKMSIYDEAQLSFVLFRKFIFRMLPRKYHTVIRSIIYKYLLRRKELI